MVVDPVLKGFDLNIAAVDESSPLEGIGLGLYATEFIHKYLRFNPTDQELMERLEAKVRDGGARSDPLIDKFIPTIEVEYGYPHPQQLPGVTMDGTIKHFFCRPRAFESGRRKHRKIKAERNDRTAWHKTGKSMALKANGRLTGWKNILVLYTNTRKTNWVMHEYRLSDVEDEEGGELVLCKIFYQTGEPKRRSVLRTQENKCPTCGCGCGGMDV
ncbi:hypothetical protein CFC21_024378 [Triticum aestivum]|uniref:NAC domain-containing protein n=2 Tax=Triticum aestivum TaxID=4565 RepID=A0A9R1JA18_WHEAT|nr:NAC domain-containing protein 73-like isoform X2 [Triticum aestivum]KAF7009890.1 hypothetical protein CFC21_024378 [Triticum aestivum]